MRIAHVRFSECNQILKLTVVVKNGCAKASLTVIRFSGSTTKHFRMRSFGSSAKIKKNGNKLIKSVRSCAGKKFNLPEISAHSGDVKLYLPSIIFRSMTICFRCQNGGHPTSNVNTVNGEKSYGQYGSY